MQRNTNNFINTFVQIFRRNVAKQILKFSQFWPYCSIVSQAQRSVALRSEVSGLKVRGQRSTHTLYHSVKYATY